MGGADKGLIPFRGQPLIEHVLERVSPQASEVIINANRNLQQYTNYGVRVILDRQHGGQGPLAGIVSTMPLTTTPLLLTAPCDSPLLPANLAQRLYSALVDSNADLAVVNTGRLQPVFCLAKISLYDSLKKFMDNGGRKIDSWYSMIHHANADFSDMQDCFVNINMPEDIRRLASAQ